MSDFCIHEMERDFCIYCRKPPIGINQIVYITKGGQAFHNKPDCASLEIGQDYAYGKGMKNHPVTPVGWGQAYVSKHPCLTCCPDYKKS